MPVSPTVVPLHQRTAMDADEKQELARRALTLIAPGSVCFIDGGSTHAALMQALPRDTSFTLVTHSPGIAAATERLPGVTCILLGGTLYRHSMVALGAAAVEAIHRMTFDLALIGATAFHAEFGLTTGDHEEALFKAAIARRAAATATILTMSKIGAVSSFQIMPTGAVSMLVVPPSADIDGLPQTVTLIR
jgi:DeoR/GlpR family transcriptional regulator of sugar metabolism